MTKKTLILFLFLFLSLTLFADQAIIQLKEFCCPLGAQKVEKALTAVKGVTEVKMDAKNSIAYVTYDGQSLTMDNLVDVIKKTGYTVKEVSKGHAACATTGAGAVDAFHGVLHTMHVAVEEGKLDVLKEQMAAMKEKRDVLLEDAKKTYHDAPCKDSKAAAKEMVMMARKVSRSVEQLDKALAGSEADSVKETFDRLHDDFYRVLEKMSPEKKEKTAEGHGCTGKSPKEEKKADEGHGCPGKKTAKS